MEDIEIRHPSFDPGDFRNEVARYVRLLIAARLKREPDFLSQDELMRWELPHARYDAYPEWRLLEKAASTLAKLNIEYLDRCGSGGVAPTDNSTPLGRVILDIAFLVPVDGGGPNHNGWLVDVFNRLRHSEDIWLVP